MRCKFSNDFLHAIKSTFDMSVPIAGARVASAINGFVTMLMIAHLGHAELAAGALINTVYFVLLVPLWQLFFAVSVLVGHNCGAKQCREIGAVVRQGLWLSIVVGIAAILVLRHVDVILIFLGQERHLAKLTQSFFNSYIWSVIPGMWSVCLGQFLVGISKQKLSLIFSLITIPLIVGIAGVLMFGKLGCPALGIAGMGYANTITFTLLDLLLLLYIYFKPEFKPYQLFMRDSRLITAYFKEIFMIGWPIALMVAAELGMFSLATIFVGWLGESQLAAWQITIQINLVVFMFPMGIGQASTVLISQAMGSKNYAVIRNLSYAALLLGMICMVFFALVYLFIPKYLIAFFLDVKNAANNVTVHLAVLLLAASTLMNIFDVARTIIACALRGLRDTMIPMFIFVVLGCVFSLPIGYVLAFPLHLGAVGLRWGFVVGFAIGALILLKRLHKFTAVDFILKERI